jgi:hypothetical protein
MSFDDCLDEVRGFVSHWHVFSCRTKRTGTKNLRMMKKKLVSLKSQRKYPRLLKSSQHETREGKWVQENDLEDELFLIPQQSIAAILSYSNLHTKFEH